ncbi:oxidoreductase C-terminal domain-containing protein [Arthrobacter mobilis]|uniref:Reductase C-terminal domain-containing protein n=1 Tax=Arthrobacter mobilis TaxID=2724944 RepID=A0A7X6HHA4_9MICC|nr:oxidoreductase C-terminal domain-containing protein [Arthrobacter mobilis]NKX56204.1 hypothetical protein [Arthrobacter mobilis]
MARPAPGPPAPARALERRAHPAGPCHPGPPWRARPQAPGRSPYFWSDQYGVRIQFSGHAGLAVRLEIEAGDVEGHSFLAVYYRGDDPVGLLSSAQARLFAKRRRDVERSQRARGAETHCAPLNEAARTASILTFPLSSPPE